MESYGQYFKCCFVFSGAPSGLSYTEVKNSLMEIKGVLEVHNLRIWSLSVNKCALAVHLALGKVMKVLGI